MKVLFSLAAILVVLGQLIAYLITKLSYNKYPRVLGRIVKAKLDDHTGVNGNRIYKAIFEIEYEYRDNFYLSTAPILRAFELFPSFQYESKLLDTYKVGDIVEVRVNPIEPAKGFIAVAPLSITSTLVMMTIAILAVLYFLFMGEIDTDKLRFELRQWHQNTYSYSKI